MTDRHPRSASLVDKLLRVGLTAAHKMLQASWYVRRPHTLGAHALALTPERKLVFVKLRYAPGWRVPGGGRDPRESPEEAGLRELREEIGLTSHGRVRLAREFEETIRFKHDISTLLIVNDVEYRPHRWSLEIEQVAEFDIDALPPDTVESTRAWVRLMRSQLG